MKPTRIIASLSLAAAVLLALSSSADASLDGTNPCNGAHHVRRDADIKARFSASANGAGASTFIVRGRHSGLHTGTYSGNGSSNINFASGAGYRAGERVDVTLTTGITGLGAPEVFSFRTRATRSSAEFDSDLLSAPLTGTWPNLVAPARLLPFSSAYFYYGSAAGDVNGDGIPDVAVCSPFGPAAVFLWFTPANLSDWDNFAGHIAFASSYVTVTPTASGLMYGVAIGDVDNDGYGDVLMCMSGNQVELARYNPQTSTFDTPAPFGLSTGGEHVSLGDLNGDGRLDAVVSGQPNFYCLNNGQGGFDAPVSLNNASFSNENALADVDNDGDLDIVFIHGSGGVAEQDVIYFNNGNGTFGSTMALGSPMVSMGVDTGDLNGDGLIDIAVATNSGVVCYLNAGSGQFTTGATVAGSAEVAAVALGDLDGDGDLDLAVGVGEAGSNGQSMLAFNHGDATFPDTTPIGLANNGHWGPDIQLLDLDGDNDLDYFSGRASGGPFYLLNGAKMYDAASTSFVYEHNGQDPAFGAFTPAANSPAASASTNISAGFSEPMSGLAAANFNVRGLLTGKRTGAISGNTTATGTFNPTQDFKPGEIVEVSIRGLYAEAVVQDFVTTGTPHTTQQPLVGGDVMRFRVAAQAGPLEFDQKAWTAISASQSTMAVACGDLDGDTQVELVFGFASGNAKVVSIGASGASTPWDVTGSAADIRALDLADVDGDGDLDLAVGVFNGQSKVYLYNAATDSFSGSTSFGAGNDAVQALQFADMNADGHPDLVVGRASAQDQVFLNDGAGNFTAGGAFGNGGIDTSALAIGDIDNDGDLDVFEGNFGGYNYVWLNDGRGNLNGSVRVGNQGVQTRAAEMADLNGDGWVDVVVGEYAGISTVHLNDHGSFPTEVNLGSGSTYTQALKLGDFDGDGDLDIVTATLNQGCGLFLNNGSGAFSSGGTFGPNDANSIAVADMDGDGDLDVGLGRFNQPDLIRFNELLPTVGFGQTQYTVNESAGSATVTVQLSQAHNLPVSVNWAAAAGTATSGTDFTTASGTLNFSAGQTSKTFSVAILNDTLDETDETVSLSLSNVNGGVMGTSAATLSILDDDGAPTVRFTTATHVTGESGSVDVFVELSNPSGLPVTVDYASINGTATAGVDYSGVSGQLTFAAGVLSQSFNVAISSDIIDEPDETFDITLSNPTNATTGALNVTTVTITDDDATPQVNLAPTSMTVEENAGTLNFNVSLSGPSSVAVTVEFVTMNGTAAAGQDFSALSGTLVIPAGSTSGTIALTIIDDSENEPVESFQLLLTNPVGATLGADTQSSITILQDQNDIFQVGGAKGGNGGGGGGCSAASGNPAWLFLLLIAMFGFAVLRTRRAR